MKSGGVLHWMASLGSVRASRARADEVGRFVAEGESVLDIGCGNGALAHFIGRARGVTAVGLDVGDYRDFPIDLVVGRGDGLPFRDGAFDVVVIAYVLHHAPDQEAMLREAQRVARQRIVIYEDTPESAIHRLACRLHGVLFNLFWGLGQPYRFRSAEEWTEAFRDAGLMVQDRRRFWGSIGILLVWTAKTRFVLGVRSYFEAFSGGVSPTSGE